MRIRHAEIEYTDWESPKGRFGIAGRRHLPPAGTECPFELEHVVLHPGKRNFPFHAHGAQWELYYALSGTATMRSDVETVELAAGDSYLCRPGLAHQLINDSAADFVYLVIANESTFDSAYFPDTGKLAVRNPIWGSLPQGRFWHICGEEIGYWEGEE